MKIAIIGATGLIGRNLVRSLMNDRHDPWILTRDLDRAKKIFPECRQIVSWNGSDAVSLARIIAGVDALINLAGENIASGRWTATRRRKILNSRVIPTRAIAEAIPTLVHKPKVWLQASATGFYGNRGDEILDEYSAPGNGFLAEVTRQWEDSARTAESHTRLVFLRTGVVFSDRGGALPKLAMPFRYYAGGPVGSGKQWISWIHIKDEVRAITFLLENPMVSGVYNLTAPSPIQMEDMAKLLARVLRKPSWAKVPSLVIKLLFGQMGEESILASQKVIPHRLTEAGFSFQFSDPEQALTDLLGK